MISRNDESNNTILENYVDESGRLDVCLLFREFLSEKISIEFISQNIVNRDYKNITLFSFKEYAYFPKYPRIIWCKDYLENALLGELISNQSFFCLSFLEHVKEVQEYVNKHSWKVRKAGRIYKKKSELYYVSLNDFNVEYNKMKLSIHENKINIDYKNIDVYSLYLDYLSGKSTIESLNQDFFNEKIDNIDKYSFNEYAFFPKYPPAVWCDYYLENTLINSLLLNHTLYCKSFLEYVSKVQNTISKENWKACQESRKYRKKSELYEIPLDKYNATYNVMKLIIKNFVNESHKDSNAAVNETPKE